MDKLNDTIKIKVGRSRDKSRKIIRNDNRVMSLMDFKMRLRHNSWKLSRYVLTRKEQEVIKGEILIMMNSLTCDLTKKIGITEMHFDMIDSIYDDLERKIMPDTGYNKRALIEIISIIRLFWANETEYVSLKEGHYERLKF